MIQRIAHYLELAAQFR